MKRFLFLGLITAPFALLAAQEQSSGHGPYHRAYMHCPPPSHLGGTYPAPMYRRPARQVVSVGAYDNYFEPKTINVPLGTTVRWTNYGKHGHTVTSSARLFDSGDLPPGYSYSVTFTRPGTHYYVCRFHTKDKMEGTIVVGQGGYGPSAGYGNSGPSAGYGGQAAPANRPHRRNRPGPQDRPRPRDRPGRRRRPGRSALGNHQPWGKRLRGPFRCLMRAA